jgi:purine nucleosidase
MTRQIIIDTDPGTDDAVAILLALASPELEVVGVTAVAGNLPLAQTEWNARAICELAGRTNIPVYVGCPRPISAGSMRDAGAIHGEHGLGDLHLPPPSVPAQTQQAVNFLIERLRGSPAKTITICALAPLTNIATALIMAPDIAGRIAELVVMGGASHGGNVTPVAEFNIHCDPRAAAIVFESRVPVTMVPLDMTQQVLNTPERIARIRALGNRCGEAAAALMLPPQPRGDTVGRRVVALHDPCVIAWLLSSELFAGNGVNVAVETESPLSVGMTVVDWRGVSGRAANARVLHSVDADAFYDLLADRLARLP